MAVPVGEGRFLSEGRFGCSVVPEWSRACWDDGMNMDAVDFMLRKATRARDQLREAEQAAFAIQDPQALDLAGVGQAIAHLLMERAVELRLDLEEEDELEEAAR